MVEGVPEPCLLYRLVHFENLASILQSGGMWCGAEMARQQLPYKQIGLQDLTRTRSEIAVRAGPGGNLTDYIPFYFWYQSVMLYQIHTGRVDTYQGGQEPLLYVVTSVQRILAAGLPFAFTDQHAKTKLAQTFDDPADLGKLNWEAIRSSDFRRREDDPARLDQKQAEFLVHSFVPWSIVQGVGVFSERWKNDCEQLLEKFDQNTRVKTFTNWYF